MKVTFEYDALGRRVSRSHSSGNVVYVHAGQQVIADYARGAVTSSPTYRYVYADYVDEPILRHTGTGTTLPTTGDNALYYHRNQQYSIIGLTNAAGTLVERYSYTAYGTLGIYDASGTVRTTSTYNQRYTYTGREYDADLNLYHFRARWYDPATGGFISRDPLGYIDGMSLYRGYFGVSKTDPTGLNPAIVIVGGVIVVGGGAITITAGEAIAATFGLTLAACMIYQPCAEELIKAAQNAGNDAARAYEAAKDWVTAHVRYCIAAVTCTFRLDGASHYWYEPTLNPPFVKRCFRAHYQIDCYVRGVSFSHISIRFPFGPCCKFKNCQGGVVH